ncbi:hypothetical protein TcasGA2_TC000891 [Tribolium castaneum]|uniref:Uncharacterized protein n=1 Tax=Tribolium castaneum TaxID=7070 RepID=D6W909_TRICA|nr:hypothetical protein TcasGA2_TC000891 [Tribolium castaneum]
MSVHIPNPIDKYNFASRNIIDYDSEAIIFMYSGEASRGMRRTPRNGGSMLHIKRIITPVCNRRVKHSGKRVSEEAT